MASKLGEYRLVQNGKAFDIDDEHPFSINTAQRSWNPYWRTKFFVLALVLSVALNVAGYFQLGQQKALAFEATHSKFGKIR